MEGGNRLAFPTSLWYRALDGSRQPIISCDSFAALIVKQRVRYPQGGPDRLTHEVDESAADQRRYSKAELMTESDYDASLSGYSLQ